MTKRLRIYSRLVPALPVEQPWLWRRVGGLRLNIKFKRCWLVQGDNGTCAHGTHAAAIECASRRAFAAAMEEATC